MLFRRSIRFFIFFGLLLWQLPLSAASVQALVSPAWLQYNGVRQALMPGQQISPKGIIETGLGGKVRLLLEDGAVLKLGADSRLRLEGRELTLLTGLLRLKLPVKSRGKQQPYRIYSQGRPNLELLEGSEMWLKLTINSWRACRVKGFVAVEKSPVSGFLLNRPRSCFEWLADEAQGQLRTLSKSRLKERLRESNIVQGSGILTDKGRWVAYLGAFYQGKGSERMVSRLRQQGFPVEREMAYFSGEEWQRIMIRGFYEESEALAFTRRHRSWSGKKMWVEEQ